MAKEQPELFVNHLLDQGSIKIVRIIKTLIETDLREIEDMVLMIFGKRGEMLGNMDILKTGSTATPRESTTVLVGRNSYLNKMEDGRETMGEDDFGTAAKIKDRIMIEANIK